MFYVRKDWRLTLTRCVVRKRYVWLYVTLHAVAFFSGCTFFTGVCVLADTSLRRGVS